MAPDVFLDHLKELSWYKDQAVHVEKMPARVARFGAPAATLAPPVLAALEAKGSSKLYVHQARAIDAALAGHHVAVCTSTASGKSLCYNVPILQALSEDPEACAIYMFPTKALAQDQRAALQALVHTAFGAAAPSVDVYDGDTFQTERPVIRRRAQLLITNPDMLHVSILPMHSQFAHVLSKLRYVVVDEGHMYKGAFGCHTALVLRRLRRLCAREYGAHPRFIVTSATSADPHTHVSTLLGVDAVTVVDDDGSPHGPRRFVLWNPPIVPKDVKKAQQMLDLAGASPVDQSADVGADKPQNGSSGRAPAGESEDASGAGPAQRGRGRRGKRAREASQPVALDSPGDSVHASALLRKRQRAGLAPGPLPASLAEQSIEDAPAAALDEGCPADGAVRTAEGAAVCAPGEPLPEDAAEVHSPQAAVTTDTPFCSPPASSAPGAGHVESAGATEQGEAGWSRAGTVNAAKKKSREARAAAVRRLEVAALVDGALQPVVRPALRTIISKGGQQGRLVSDPQVQREIAADLPERWSKAQKASCAAARAADAARRKKIHRSSPIVEISRLLAECVQHGLRTIAFCKTRKTCELVTAYTREILMDTAPVLAGSVAVYRGGYSPAERRGIERALGLGELRAVAATNALELGIDIGGLDVTLHLGYPGSVASMWQQAGRAGRREQCSLSVFVAFDGPLDQYFMRDPAALFQRAIESVQVDAQNPIVMRQQLMCASAELPLLPASVDLRFFGPTAATAVRGLLHDGLLGRSPADFKAYRYVGGKGNPARDVSLRAIDPDRFSIVDTTTGQVIEEIEESMAFYEIYDGAVYMFQGKTFLCKSLDLGTKVALVDPTEVNYYTKTKDYAVVHVVGGRSAYVPSLGSRPAPSPAASQTGTITSARPAGGGRRTEASAAPLQPRSACGSQQCTGERPVALSHAACGDGEGLPCSACFADAVVTTRFVGYHRIRRGAGTVFDTVDLYLPDVQFETKAAYVRIPDSVRAACTAAGVEYYPGLHAARHALVNVVPLLLVCNVADIKTECDVPGHGRYRPQRMLIYDAHPGGLGLCERACHVFEQLMTKALALVRTCTCVEDSGCPSCVQLVECGEYNANLSKAAAIVLLQHCLKRATEHCE